MTEIEEKWITDIAKHLVGRSIVKVSYLSKDEADENGWCHRPIILDLDDGSSIMPMRDDEGNDGGALATSINDLPTIGVL